MNKRVKRLQLHAETLRQLDSLEIEQIAGGLETLSNYCPPSFTRCSNLCGPMQPSGDTCYCTYTIDQYSNYDIGCR
jgi:hypothetical protein